MHFYCFWDISSLFRGFSWLCSTVVPGGAQRTILVQDLWTEGFKANALTNVLSLWFRFYYSLLWVEDVGTYPVALRVYSWFCLCSGITPDGIQGDQIQCWGLTYVCCISDTLYLSCSGYFIKGLFWLLNSEIRLGVCVTQCVLVIANVMQLVLENVLASFIGKLEIVKNSILLSWLIKLQNRVFISWHHWLQNQSPIEFRKY